MGNGDNMISVPHEIITGYPEFDDAIIEIVKTLRSKNKDYTGDVSTFRNFTDAAEDARTDVATVIEVQLGIKNSRRLSLLETGAKPNNEPLIDTYKDRACYSIIAYAWHLLQSKNMK